MKSWNSEWNQIKFIHISITLKNVINLESSSIFISKIDKTIHVKNVKYVMVGNSKNRQKLTF